ncbi:MAG: hypothetical protein Q9185_003142 [Variospora sp. 1 TL-2023]
MPELSILGSLAPYHIITYGTLLGSSVFEVFPQSLKNHNTTYHRVQSFIGGPVAFKALPRAQFASLQSAIFPIYFSLETVLPVLLAWTYPAAKSLTGISSQSGFSGVFAKHNRLDVLAPIATTFAIHFANLAYIGPQTTKIMKLRKHQETRDGKKSHDPAPHSPEMQKLNRKFGIMHSVSASLNLVALAATVWYGVVLAERLQ